MKDKNVKKNTTGDICDHLYVYEINWLIVNLINTLRHEQYGAHFAGGSFKSISLNKIHCL